MDRLLTVKQCASRLNVAPRTVYRQIANGELNATKVGRQWRIDLTPILEGQSSADDRDRLNLIMSHMRVPSPTAIPGNLDPLRNVAGSYEDQVGDVRIRWTLSKDGKLVLWADQETEDWLAHHYPKAYTEWAPAVSRVNLTED